MGDTTISAALCGVAFLLGYMAGKARTLTVTMRQMEKMTRELEFWKEKCLKPASLVDRTRWARDASRTLRVPLSRPLRSRRRVRRRRVGPCTTARQQIARDASSARYRASTAALTAS